VLALICSGTSRYIELLKSSRIGKTRLSMILKNLKIRKLIMIKHVKRGYKYVQCIELSSLGLKLITELNSDRSITKLVEAHSKPKIVLICSYCESRDYLIYIPSVTSRLVRRLIGRKLSASKIVYLNPLVVLTMYSGISIFG